MAIKNRILIIFILVFGSIHSQKLSFIFKPSYNFLFGTYTLKRLTPENQIKFYSDIQNRISFAQGSFAFDLNVFEYKKLNFGLSYYTGSAANFLKHSYSSEYYHSDTAANLITKLISKQGGSSTIKQFGVYASYEYKYKRLTHSMSLYFHFMKDHTETGHTMDHFNLFTDGILTSDFENFPGLYDGKNGFSTMLRYDLSFLTKKDKNIMNVFVAFQQGFTQMGYFTLDVKHSLGFSMKAEAKTRGSFLAIGIAKPIKIWKGSKQKKEV
jgi:hypothetical protein